MTLLEKVVYQRHEVAWWVGLGFASGASTGLAFAVLEWVVR